MPRRPSLKALASAAPCPSRWSKLPGTDRVRHCASCGSCVYRLDGLPSGDADALLTWNEGHPVTHLFVRKDGAVLTRDCPVGRAARARRERQHERSRWAALALVASGLVGLAASAPEAAPPSHAATPLAAVERPGEVRIHGELLGSYRQR